MKTLLLTGGSGDIGQAIKAKFEKNDFSVISPMRNELDLSDRSSIDSYMNRNHISVNAIVHCAGINNPEHFEKLDYADIDSTNNVNFISFFKMLQSLLTGMKEKNGGHIVVISSIYGIYARDKRLPYVISKHALNGLVKTLAIELGPFNIKINAVSPGFVNTKMTRKNNDQKTINNFIGKIPLRRLAEPSDIANITYFLCSDENNYINGQNIIIDGGYSIGGFQD